MNIAPQLGNYSKIYRVEFRLDCVLEQCMHSIVSKSGTATVREAPGEHSS